jgi:hypothetical protein
MIRTALSIYVYGWPTSGIVALDDDRDLGAVPVGGQRRAKVEGLFAALVELARNVRVVGVDGAVIGEALQLDDARLIMVQVNVKQTVCDVRFARLGREDLGVSGG